MDQLEQLPPVLTSDEVADLFGVGIKAVNTWARSGKLPCWRTPTGYLRFDRDQILVLRQQSENPAPS